MLHHLRRQLDKVASHARHAIIVNILKEIVQAMSKLVEQGCRLVGTQQRRLARSGLAEVADDRHDRSETLAVLVGLRAVSAAPGATTLAGPREEVEIDHAQMRAILVLALEDLSLGIRQRHVLQRREGDAIQLVGHIEGTLAHVIEFQVRTDVVLVKVELGLLGFLEIIAPIPALGLKIATLFLDLGVDVGQLAFRLGQSRRPDLIEQLIDIRRVLRHTILEGESGIILIAHQFGLGQTGAHQLADNLLVIVLVVVVATVDVSLEDLLTKLAIISVLQERHNARVLQGEDPFARHARLLGSLGRVGDQRLGQARKILFLVDHQLERVGLLQHVLAKGQLQHGDLAVQLAQLSLVGLRQVGATAHEILIGLLEKLHLLLVEAQLVFLVINRLDTGEQLRVEVDIVVVFREDRRHLAAQGLHLVVGVDTVLSAKDDLHLAQQGALLVEGDDRVLEGRFLRVVDDRVDLLAALLDALHHRGLVVLKLDLVEWRHAERGRVLREERVLRLLPGLFLARAARGQHHSQSRCHNQMFHNALFSLLVSCHFKPLFSKSGSMLGCLPRKFTYISIASSMQPGVRTYLRNLSATSWLKISPVSL